MSESSGASSVIPFKPGEEAGEGDSPGKNPMERLHLAEAVRMAEAIVFASAEPVSAKQLAARLPDGIDVTAAMAELQQIYARRGVNLVRVGDSWAFRTAGDLALVFMSRGGVFLTGGIAPKILPALKAGNFRAAFEDKAPHSALMRTMPVYVVTQPLAALAGLAAFARTPSLFGVETRGRRWQGPPA